MKTIWVLAALGVLLPAIPAHAERLCSCKSGPSEVGNKWVGNGQQTTIHRERNIIKEQGPSGPNLELREHGGGGGMGHGMRHQGGGANVKIKP